MNDPIYCSKCKKKKSNSNAIMVQSANGRWRVSAQCLKCKTNKIPFIKERVRFLLAKELHRPVRTHFRKRRIITKGIDDLSAAGLIDKKKIF
jgi:hypothetical protein